MSKACNWNHTALMTLNSASKWRRFNFWVYNYNQGYLTCHILALRYLMSTYFYSPVSIFPTHNYGWEKAMFGLKSNFYPLVWRKRPCFEQKVIFYPLVWMKKNYVCSQNEIFTPAKIVPFIRYLSLGVM